MDEAIRITASALVGGAIGYVAAMWRRVPDIPVVNDVIDYITQRSCEHRFDTKHRDGRFRCGICGKQAPEDK